jgi:hypothetical protein
MKNYTWEYIQKYPKQTKRLLGIDYQQLEQLMALGKLIHRKNQSEIEKTKIRINQPGSGTPPKLLEEEQIVLMLVYLRHHLSFQIWLFVTWYGSIGRHKSTKSLSGRRLN